MDKEILQSAINMIVIGKSEREISRELNVDRCTLRYALKKQNIHSKYKQGKRPKEFKSKFFKGETKTSYGYVLIKMPSHPNADKRGYIRRSHLIMEIALGRYLSKSEVIHHKNFKKDDDILENLQLCSTTGEHSRLHEEVKRNVKNTK